jgi:hypothetical protein
MLRILCHDADTSAAVIAANPYLRTKVIADRRLVSGNVLVVLRF